jgi:hypothetical protein
MAVIFIICAAGWLARCRQRLCSVLRVLVAGTGTGALVLAVLALAGIVSPQLIVVLTLSVILTGVIALYGALSKCW